MPNISMNLNDERLEDARAYIYILAHQGNWAMAAAELGITLRQLNKQVESWALRGPDYKRMYLDVRNAKFLSVLDLSDQSQAAGPVQVK